MPVCTEPCDPEISGDSFQLLELDDEHLNITPKNAYVGGRQLSTMHFSAHNTPRMRPNKRIDALSVLEPDYVKASEQSGEKESRDNRGLFGLLRQTFNDVHEKIRQTIYSGSAEKRKAAGEMRARSQDREYATADVSLAERPRPLRMQSFYESAAKNPLAGSRRLEALDTMAENKLVLPHPTRRGFFNFDEELSSFTEAPPRRIGSHRQGPVDLRAVVCRSGSRDVEQR